MESAETLKAQELELTAELIGQSVAKYVGLMLGLLDPEEVDTHG